MSVEPVAIDADLLAKVRDVAGPDLAAFVEAAIEAALREQEFGRILDDLRAEAEASGTPADL
ncbi:MAG: hypothetical protein M3450_00785 [Actinomycetota bacterium]|nr:hypothetical protein [Actinomycetota bacterium]